VAKTLPNTFKFKKFHSTTLSLSANLAILSTGLSLTNVGAMNVTILSTPRQFMGISLGTSMLMRIVGAAVGPALAGMYMQSNQSISRINGIARYFPSGESYNLIFLTATALSVVVLSLLTIMDHLPVTHIIANGAQESRVSLSGY
jgi:hypothetical protein